MPLSYLLSSLTTFISLLLAIAFFTLLERNVLGYIQVRNGPNNVGLAGLPQPFADALNLFVNEQAHPNITNLAPFYFAPILSLFLALFLWAIYPTTSPATTITFGVLLFLCISSLNVYATISAGWSSNSNYALIGALRAVAQTISYEVSISLILLSCLLTTNSYNFILPSFNSFSWASILIFPIFIIWFITLLAETNRTPFDLAEGESELVSGFNTEYSSGPFALIFIAEYISILAMSIFTAALFTSSPNIYPFGDLIFSANTLALAFSFIWVRGTLPRIRYDRLISLTWNTFLPVTLTVLLLISTTLI